MCRLQFYQNIQKKSTNPSIRTLVSTLQCRFLCVFMILPYTHSANGYRSLHLVVRVPVFLAESTEYIPVEVQIRTIAMDFWASLEHQLKYKSTVQPSPELHEELHKCAEDAYDLDVRMQSIYQSMHND